MLPAAHLVPSSLPLQTPRAPQCLPPPRSPLWRTPSAPTPRRQPRPSCRRCRRAAPRPRLPSTRWSMRWVQGWGPPQGGVACTAGRAECGLARGSACCEAAAGWLWPALQQASGACCSFGRTGGPEPCQGRLPGPLTLAPSLAALQDCSGSTGGGSTGGGSSGGGSSGSADPVDQTYKVGVCAQWSRRESWRESTARVVSGMRTTTLPC